MSKIKILRRESYLAMIENSVGSTAFNTVYGVVGGKKQDILNAGELSCAYFLSSLLKLFELIGEVHVTVDGMLRDMRSSGWEEVDAKDLRPGSVILWSAKEYDDGPHRHIGFSVGDDEAVSTDYQQRKVARHHYTFEGKRLIEMVFTHDKLREGRDDAQ